MLAHELVLHESLGDAQQMRMTAKRENAVMKNIDALRVEERGKIGKNAKRRMCENKRWWLGREREGGEKKKRGGKKKGGKQTHTKDYRYRK